MDTNGVILALATGYVLGSIPFGLILTRLTGAGDLRSIGSGSTGATNVLRTGRKGLAAATLLLDLVKGFAAVWVTGQLMHGPVALAGLAAIIGHCFPVWLGFRGGKGVATLMGVSLGLAWPIGMAYAVVWLGTLALTRISSLAGMSAALAAPLTALAIGRSDLAVVLTVLALLVIFLHRANITRLRAGSEPRVGSGANKDAGGSKA